MKYIIVASALAATASAFAITDFPACSLTCVTGGKVKLPTCVDISNPDSPDNVKCLCSDQQGFDFQNGMNTCVKAKGGCEAADQCSLYKVVQKICAGTKLQVSAPDNCDSGAPPAAGPPAAEPTTAPPAAGGASPPPSSSTEEAPIPTSSAAASAVPTSEAPSSSAGGSYGAPASSTVATSASSTANSTSAPVASEIAVGAASANAVNGVVALVAGLIAAFAL